MQPSVETLEDRKLLTASLGPTGVLLIQGGATNDWGWVSPVSQNGKNYYRAYGNLENKTFDNWSALSVKTLAFEGIRDS